MITKSKARVLILGCGDIGIRLVRQLSRDYVTTGLCRSPQILPDTIAPLACDLNNPRQVRLAIATGFDYLVFTLTAERSESAYRQSFLTNLSHVLDALVQTGQSPRRLLFVSSTSVFAQDNGEWLTETSPAQAERYNGRIILQAEKRVSDSQFPSTIVRFSGIYGPGRDRLLTRVRQGRWDPADRHYTNRIHADDCARVLAFLIELDRNGTIDNLYLATDNEPAPACDVNAWLADQLNCPLPPAATLAKGKGKRCSNARLRKAGFQFLYPSYREGYRTILP